MPGTRTPATILSAVAACVLGLGAPASAEDRSAVEAQKTLESILAKEGITLGGAFRSEYLHSSIGGPGALSSRRSEESVEFTSVDFDVRARPNTATQGRLVIRMHQDWRNFFSDIGNPINTRWLSLDGTVKGMFSYSAGDFLERYSPLTLSAAAPEILYEPAVFAGTRREAMDEAFLDGNKRLLQGVRLGFDAAVDQGSRGLLKELHVGLLGSRLRNVEANIQNGNKATAAVERSPVEKFLAGGNLDAVLPLGVSLGGTSLLIFDKKGSYAGTGDPDTAAQHTLVASGRAGYAFSTDAFKIGLDAEYALSKDDSIYFALPADTNKTSKTLDGSALLARLHGEWKAGKAFGIKAGVGYLANDENYRNELAQSPVFIGERILNIENDTSKVRTNDRRARNYSSFDALYRHVYKFIPSEGTNLWQRAPFQKNSWNSAIMNQNEMAAFAALRADPALQLVMPFGPATANRAGMQGDLTLEALDERIEAKVLFASLENTAGMRIDSVRMLPKTKFSQAGGGIKIEAGGFLGLALPLTFSGSFVRSTSENAGLAGDTLHPAASVTSDFSNAGAQYVFWKRFSLQAGWQQISTTFTTAATEAKQVQTQQAAGLGYKVAAGAQLLFSLGQVKVDQPAGALDTDFSQLQTDLFLTVHF